MYADLRFVNLIYGLNSIRDLVMQEAHERAMTSMILCKEVSDHEAGETAYESTAVSK
ncbi:hypothetical protein DOTSEDRAFT_68983 [Dothistroma septosporum NZE10]|uniref:Uncharacterized protein n=1 Tax=Dothistroma septosporum (strain NZE10 / CBS 128990) TaxID=675120 RepID=N1Q3N7_DOTSN|nr:hypothetical protein DOTSEDRAFT_68983 [Dothistroma septosporum NZE10]